jgi:hypothetical protein
MVLAAHPLGRAAAAVLPQHVLAAAFASAKNLKRAPIPLTTLTLPYYKLRGTDAQGYVAYDTLDYGYLANGSDVLIVPLESGGSGGVFSTLLFTAARSRPAFVGVLSSPAGHLDVHLQTGKIVVRTPIYGVNDPNCCPSAHKLVRYTLVGGKLKKLDEFRTS